MAAQPNPADGAKSVSGGSGRLYFDDFQLYDRALSDGEVAGLAGRTLPFDKPF